MSSLLWAEQAPRSKSVVTGEALQTSDHFCDPPLDPLYQVHVFLVDLRAACSIPCRFISEQRRREEEKSHQPQILALFIYLFIFLNAAQDTIEFLVYECALLAHIQFLIEVKVDDIVFVVHPFPSNAVAPIAGVNFFITNQQLITWK